MTDVADSLAAGVAEEREDFGDGDAGLFAYWQTQEKLAEKEERTWVKRARKIIRRYRDERADTSGLRDTKKFNILWSNVETLTPVLYGRTPKADVERRFKDQDDVARLASILLERSLNYCIEAYDFDGVMRPCVQDRLLPGRGVARVMYIPHYGAPLPNGDQQEEAGEYGETAAAIVASEGDEGKQEPQEALREVVYEEARCAYVFWEDYREGPARVWAEVPWVRYRSYLTREELIARFGKEKGSKVTLDFTPKGDERDPDTPPDAYKKAIVHEYWDKSKLQTIWIAPGTADLILDKQDDPLKLTGFFPNPDPLLATTTTDKRIPVPDYIEYQDQAVELDDLTQRINKLTRALRAKGIYAGEEKDSLQRLFDLEDDTVLIPVENWAALAGKGGLANVIEWVPIQQIAGVLVQLYEARDKVKQVIYEITGIADILRGATSPSETLGAQQIKTNFATLRISPKQKDVARFARDLIRLKADIIANHFSPKTISLITGYPQLLPVPPLPPQPVHPPVQATQASQIDPQTGQPMPAAPDPAMAQYQAQMAQWQQQAQAVQAVVQANQQKQAQFEAAVALLKQDATHDFKIDIEADSTIAPDEQAEKMARVEFLQQMVPLLQQVVPVAQGNPALADLSKEIVLFAVRGFRVARSLEEAFENAFDQLKKMPPNENTPGQGKEGKGGGQDPAVAKAAIDQKAQAAQQANAIKQQQVQGQLALEAQRNEADAQIKAGKLALENEKFQTQKAFRQAEMMNVAARAAQGLA
jgi:hypothetical protein